MKSSLKFEIRPRRLQLIIGILSVFILWPSPSYSGVMRVTPVKLTFDQQFKNGMVWVFNEGEEDIQIEIRATEWTQDPKGSDQYTETKDIIFFPKIIKIEKGKDRAIRVGVKSLAISSEKTYRLFIKEMAQATKDTQGSQVRFALQFGVPIFVKPVKEDIQGMIEKISHGVDQLKITVRNTGNVHFRIESIRVRGLDTDGEETFSQELSGWYMLAGATRSYETPIGAEVCLDSSKFDVEVKADQLMLHDEMDVIKTLCTP